MTVGTVVAFWAVSLLFVLTPGADWAYAIAAGLGHRTVLPAVGGLLVGHLAATVAVAAGVAALVARSLMVLTVLTVVGAAYLVWLGIATLARPSALDASAERPADSWVRQAMKGAATSALNPKVFLLFLALLPQFTEPDTGWPLGGADRGAGVGSRGELRCDLHGRGRLGATCAEGEALGGAGGDPHLRCCDGRDRSVAAGGTAHCLEARGWS